MNDLCVWSSFVLLHDIDIFPLTPYTVFPHRPRMSSPFPADESRTDMDPSRQHHHPYVLDFLFEGPLQRGLSLVIYILQSAFLFCPDQMVKRSENDEEATHC